MRRRIPMDRRSFIAANVAICGLTAGCSALPRLQAVPPQDEVDVTILGMRDARYWGDRPSPALIAEATASYDRELTAWRRSGHTSPLPPASYLAISGGGEDGAFGAGLLVGWTSQGSRPQFKLVTGVSTGALTAPFAFLGSDYDRQLRAVYTQTSARNVLSGRGLLGFGLLAALTEDALNSNAPLRKTIGRYVTQSTLDDIAAEYSKGRLLLIGTTNLDEGRPVIWNITKLAASKRPGVLGLVRQILIASTAIPGAFPPEMIDVEVDGRKYQEMHVDGGASAQVFVYPPSLQIAAESRRRNITRVRHLFVIRNARLDPQWEEIRRRTLGIVSRAISSLIQTQGVGDLYRIYVAAVRDHIDFNMAYIPPTFREKLKTPFDSGYMQALFDVGCGLGTAGYSWFKLPPGYGQLGSGPTLQM